MRILMYALLAMGAWLMPVQASAQTLTDAQIAALHKAAQTRLYAECSRTSDTLSYRSGYSKYKYEFFVQWTGGCVDNLKDGSGQFTTETRSKYKTNDPLVAGRHDYSHVWEGTIVRGRQVGLWCLLTISSDGVPMPQDRPTCSLISGDASIGSFGREADGSWRRLDYKGAATEPPEVYAEGSLEAESERLIAAARTGSFGGPINLLGQAAALDDLVAGASIRLSPDPSVKSIRGKRVAIVLSSRAVTELDRWAVERQAVIDALERYRRKESFAEYIADFIRTSDPNRLVMGATATVVSAGAIPFAADDLSVLQDGSADYALVVDWNHYANLPTTARALRAVPVCETNEPCENGVMFSSSRAMYLLTPDLRAIVTTHLPGITLTRHSADFDDLQSLVILLDNGANIDASAHNFLPGGTFRYVE